MADQHKKESQPETPAKNPEPKVIRELFKWESPARPFKKRNKRFYVNLGIMLFVIALIALFLQEFFLIAVLMAVFFYYYVAGTVEPVAINHRITNRGIETAGHDYSWDDLREFWFTEKYEETVIQVSTNLRFPGRLIMLIPFKDKEKVHKILGEHLTYQEIPPVNWIDNVLEWWNSKLPASMR